MAEILNLVELLNRHVLWGVPMVALMLGTGLFLTWVTRGMLFRRFSVVMRYTVKSLFQKGDSPRKNGTITPFQAVCTALAATVGTGNIVGVALAIATGGPGAVFWLWISALAGMVVKFCEVTLSQAYRTANPPGRPVGGPMYYIENGMGKKWLAALFAVLGSLAALGIGASVQANALSGGIQMALGLPGRIIGLAVAALGGLIFLGGIRRIASVTELLVPFMSALYILGSLLVLVLHARRIPAAFGSIFRSIFTGTAAKGGFWGATAMQACRVGMARGVFTHEAGMGSAPIAHGAAGTDHPARQGLWGAFEVFFDSIVLCTVTALVILTSGLWSDQALAGDGGAISALAFERAFPGGGYIVTLGLTLFAFATIVAWYYYGAVCLDYLSGGCPWARRLYQLGYISMTYWGCITDLEAAWALADLCNALMAIPNLVALLALWPVIRGLSDDFFRDPHRIRPENADFSHLAPRRKKG